MSQSQKNQTAAPVSAEDDFENCKGQCGYTQWCRACMEEKKKLLDEMERKEAERARDAYI